MRFLLIGGVTLAGFGFFSSTENWKYLPSIRTIAISVALLIISAVAGKLAERREIITGGAMLVAFIFLEELSLHSRLFLPLWLGALSNTTVWLANGFRMPVSERLVQFSPETLTIYIPSAEAHLSFLGDVIPLWAGSIVSIGDLLFLFGILLVLSKTCFRVFRKAKAKIQKA